MRQAVLLLALAIVSVSAAGCSRAAWSWPWGRPAGAPPNPVDSVDHIDLWAVPPAAINWDDMPGPDGVQVSVLLYQEATPQPVRVKGSLEFSMWAGRLHGSDIATAQPFQTWSFDARELIALQIRGPAGWGYGARLGWGSKRPNSQVVTVRARYVPLNGSPVSSAPILIAMPE